MLSDYKKVTTLLISLLFASSVFADKIHDPTRPKNAQVTLGSFGVSKFNASSSNGSLKLQGILNKKGTKTAIIDGERYQVGDIVNGFKISQIKLNFIVLAKGNTEKRLFVYE